MEMLEFYGASEEAESTEVLHHALDRGVTFCTVHGNQGIMEAAAAAKKDVKVLVVGNPANTNALIAQAAAPDIDPRNFTAMMRLDHNRALAQLAGRIGRHHSDISRMVVWGNHSATQYPDISHASVGGKSASDLTDQGWLTDEFIPVVQQRGAAIIKARGASSAASAASAAIDHIHDWALGTNGDDWVSMGIPADGSYGIAEGVIYSYPVRCKDGGYEIVQGLEISDFSRERMAATARPSSAPW